MNRFNESKDLRIRCIKITVMSDFLWKGDATCCSLTQHCGKKYSRDAENLKVAMAISMEEYIRRQELTMFNMLEGDIKEKRNSIDGKHTARLCLKVKLVACCGNIYTMICVSNNIDLLQTKLDGCHCTDHVAPSAFCHVLEPLFPSAAPVS